MPVQRNRLLAGAGAVALVTALATGTIIESTASMPRVTIAPAVNVLVKEGWDWFDGSVLLGPGRNGLGAVFRWAIGASEPDSGGATRIQFAPTEAVRVSFSIKLSDNWVGSGRDYHPHVAYLLSNLDGRYSSLASSRSTIYLEWNGQRPVVAVQDSLLIGSGAIAGCEPLPFAAPAPECYSTPTGRRNGRRWISDVNALTPGRWHDVVYEIRLNTAGVNNGILSVMVDGARVLYRSNVVLRSAAHPEMRLTQLALGPWLERSPIEQSMVLDDLEVRSIP